MPELLQFTFKCATNSGTCTLENATIFWLKYLKSLINNKRQIFVAFSKCTTCLNVQLIATHIAELQAHSSFKKDFLS